MKLKFSPNLNENESIGIKYSTWDLIYDVINYCACNCNAGKISEFDKIVIINWKIRIDKNQRNVYINVQLKHGLGVDFIVCSGKLVQELALKSLILFDAYRSYSTHAR